jgi:hypothetical protein
MDRQAITPRSELESTLRQRLLCFEYLPEGSLDEHITGKMMRQVFGSSVHVYVALND